MSEKRKKSNGKLPLTGSLILRSHSSEYKVNDKLPILLTESSQYNVDFMNGIMSFFSLMNGTGRGALELPVKSAVPTTSSDVPFTSGGHMCGHIPFGDPLFMRTCTLRLFVCSEVLCQQTAFEMVHNTIVKAT